MVSSCDIVCLIELTNLIFTKKNFKHQFELNFINLFLMADNNQNQNQIPKEIPKINFDNKKPVPKINFAEFAAPFKDPVPPMLRPRPATPGAQEKPAAQNELPDNNTFGMTAEDFQQRGNSDRMMSDQAREYQKQFKLRFYFPGQSPGEPHKEDTFRYCYTFFKRMSNRGVSDI